MLKLWIVLSSLGLAAAVPLASSDGLVAAPTAGARPLDALKMAFTQGSLFGSCPETPNACNQPNGCSLGTPRQYTVWHHLTRCTWGIKGCENEGTGPCKTVYFVDPPCNKLTKRLPEVFYENRCMP